LQTLLRGLSDPMVAVPEVLGLAYLLYFAWQHRRGIGCWKRRGLRRMQLERA
jgi:threonine/homoserine/homoserine lactone efflux protein